MKPINKKKESKISTYEQMWSFMSANKNAIVNSTSEGIQKVKTQRYAFLLESTTNEYARQRDCDLIQIGDLLDSKSYGLGLAKNSEWTEEISRAILLLQESGKIRQIYDKWWKQVDDVKNCDDLDKNNYNEAMHFQNIRGIFFILACGISISFLVAAIEYIYVKHVSSI
jgi:hypothetical protein